MWLGQTPVVKYVSKDSGQRYPHSRTHYEFRWWYEYSGGKMTDWGAHHVDIALWGLGKSDASMGRFTVDPKRADHPVEFKDGFPVDDTRFNTATGFDLNIKFEDGVELDIVDRSERLDFDNGVMFECEKGRFFVNRGKLTGKPVEELEEKPLTDEAFGDLYKGLTREQAEKNGVNDGVTHVRNFFDCVKSRQTPISDVASHHRHLTVCHAANIAMRLGRKVTFDPVSERFVDDEQADGLLSREPRKGFEFAT
jgi:predicted dehydrogenase